MNNEALEKELIELIIKLMNAYRFIKVYNDSMAARQVIGNCMQQVDNLLSDVDTESGLNIDIVINNEVAVCGLYAEAADCKHRVKAQCKFSGKCYFKQTDC